MWLKIEMEVYNMEVEIYTEVKIEVEVKKYGS